MTSPFEHISVMPQEVLHFFAMRPGQVLVDATAGKGGHLSAILAASYDDTRVFAFDRDTRAHQDDAALGVVKKYPDKAELIHAPFSEVQNELLKRGVTQIDGLLCDLGVSSHQLDARERGFSLKSDGPLDMRMDQTQGMTAYEWLTSVREETLADVIFKLGDERKSRQIARAIKSQHPLPDSTEALAQIVLSAMKQRHFSPIHPATRTFQAIRMAVNQEVDELSTLLSSLKSLLANNGVAVFISFHSIEDRLIKNTFKEMAQTGDFVILTKKPMTPDDEELKHNRRSRSAKLRAIRRVK